jgi:hypothetical protein
MIQPGTASGQLAAGTTAVYAKPAILTGLQVTPAAADATLTIYDNASAASGTIVAQMLVKASTSSQHIPLTIGVGCNNGVTAALSGTGATAIVYYYPLR